MRGTETAVTEGWWPPSNWPKYSVPKTQMTALMLVCAFLIYPPPRYMSKCCDVIKRCHNHLLPSFSRKSTVHVQGNCHDLPVHPPASPLTISHCHAWTIYMYVCMSQVQNLGYERYMAVYAWQGKEIGWRCWQMCRWVGTPLLHMCKGFSCQNEEADDSDIIWWCHWCPSYVNWGKV